MVTFLRTPRTAPRVFGAEAPGQLFTRTPRMKFEFVTEFIPSAGGLAMTNNANFNTYQNDRGIIFKVKTISKPKINLATDVLNQYNKKRIIYKKLDYQEVTVRLYDTYDNSVLSMWADYFTYFFGDSRPKTANGYNQVSGQAKFEDQTGWGFRPLTNVTNFFDYIKVYAFYNKTYTSFSYVNPKITSIDFGDKDYSASEPEEINISFAYEAIQYEKFGEPFGSQQWFSWGWRPEDALDLPQPPPLQPTTAQPRIFANQVSQAVNPTTVSSTLQHQQQVSAAFEGPTNSGTLNQAAQLNPQPSSDTTPIQPSGSFGGQIPVFEDPLDGITPAAPPSASLTPVQQNTAQVANNFQATPAIDNNAPPGATVIRSSTRIVGYTLNDDGDLVKLPERTPEEQAKIDALRKRLGNPVQ